MKTEKFVFNGWYCPIYIKGGKLIVKLNGIVKSVLDAEIVYNSNYPAPHCFFLIEGQIYFTNKDTIEFIVKMGNKTIKNASIRIFVTKITKEKELYKKN